MIEDYRLKQRNRTHGSSVINHKIRIKMDLSMEEYCMLDLIHRLNIQDKDFTFDRIERWIGMDVDPAKAVIRKLGTKGLIYRKVGSNRIIIDKVWQKLHDTVMEDDFEVFWRKEFGKSWMGSKKEAKLKYFKARESFTSDFLLQRKRAYFEYLSQPEVAYRQVMNAARFLNPKNEHFNEPWEQYQKDLEEKRIKQDMQVTPSTINNDQRKELFGETTNG